MNLSPPSGGVAVISRYGVAVLLAGAAVAISYPFRAHVYTTPFFFAAVFISCWYGRIGPAILATIASTAARMRARRLGPGHSTPAETRRSGSSSRGGARCARRRGLVSMLARMSLPVPPGQKHFDRILSAPSRR